MQTVTVDLGDRSYPVHIGPGLLSQPELLAPHIKGRQVCIISNDTVAPLYLKQLKAGLTEYDVSEIILPDGEKYKTLESMALIYDSMLEQRIERSATLIALGGGVIGDMAGFAAATYQRGVNFIQIPTTLLSQVDSSVGGKTGVNRPLGKNMVGAFYQPQCVLADTSTLDTLPDRELSAGMAEVIKYGLINNVSFYKWLQANIEGIKRRDTECLSYAIKVSCEEKAAIVAQDEREAGIRAILNLGHTFGHAIETAMGYGNWLHGEAVATGMVMAADLSQGLGLLSREEVENLKAMLIKADLPVLAPAEIDVEQYMDLMGRDKKAEGGNIRFVLLEKIGKAIVKSGIDKSYINETLAKAATATS